MSKKFARTLLAALCITLMLTIVGCAAAPGGGMVAHAPAPPMAMPAAPGAAAPDAGNWAMGGGTTVYGDATFGFAQRRVMAESDMIVSNVSEPPPPVEQPGVPQPGQRRMIVYTANIALQTLDFEPGVAAIEQAVQDVGGFIQSSSVSGRNLHDRHGWQRNRHAFFTVRVPQERLSGFLTGLEGGFNVSSSGLNSHDITMQFFDTQARLDSLRVQQERLLDMMGRAEDVEFLLQVERELARVGFEIEQLTSALTRMDDSVSYATVHIDLEEVIEYDEVLPVAVAFGDQARRAFDRGWRGFGDFSRSLVLLGISLTPLLVVALPVAGVVYLLLRWGKKRRAERLRTIEERYASKNGNPPPTGD